MGNSQFPKLLTAEQVAELFGVSKQTIYRMRESGMLPYYKISGAIRFAESDMVDYLESVRSEPWNKKFYINRNKYHKQS